MEPALSGRRVTCRPVFEQREESRCAAGRGRAGERRTAKTKGRERPSKPCQKRPPAPCPCVVPLETGSLTQRCDRGTAERTPAHFGQE
ncbi:hypothetical protein SKAU_G00189020 [Synaphobranchus kaupii]|uniref:Uncharacterized protein n=1 Tax=Synaphobranchus kaupii TaxID=118154 RepID=A0A9Q1IX18_SYNKA|nr:hypothetical protein SKAU_G00189020 [Synaphobranchus kaupii]